MKLLYCTECRSIFNLTLKEKTCMCGKSKGKYTDEINAVYSGSAIPIGIDNIAFHEAIARRREVAVWGELFTAFVIPKDCDTFEKTDGV